MLPDIIWRVIRNEPRRVSVGSVCCSLRNPDIEWFADTHTRIYKSTSSSACGRSEACLPAKVYIALFLYTVCHMIRALSQSLRFLVSSSSSSSASIPQSDGWGWEIWSLTRFLPALHLRRNSILYMLISHRRGGWSLLTTKEATAAQQYTPP